MTIALCFAVVVLLAGCTPAVKEVTLERDRVLIIKKGGVKFSEKERRFIKEEAEKFGIDVPESEEIKKYIAYYLRDKKGLEIALRRAKLYLPHIKKILRKHRLPEDLALLPLVESAFNPFAVSPSGAGGIWQLMPDTARRYGLRVDGEIDERFDLEKSTEAAARYLKDLYRIFGSWELVLAAYNCGEGCVSRKTGGGNFWKTRKNLPRQTRRYVPKFFAALLIARDPRKYGISVDVGELSIERKVSDRGYSVRELLHTAGIRESRFRDLNPHIKGEYVPPGAYVYLPKENTQDTHIKVIRLKNGAVLYIIP
ncbi:MAG TPA: lytic transglycosylase [Aquificaceae bacterium]|nr:lytic transglycosylase [Aquificaceae bacterium]